MSEALQVLPAENRPFRVLLRNRVTQEIAAYPGSPEHLPDLSAWSIALELKLADAGLPPAESNEYHRRRGYEVGVLLYANEVCLHALRPNSERPEAAWQKVTDVVDVVVEFLPQESVGQPDEKYRIQLTEVQRTWLGLRRRGKALLQEAADSGQFTGGALGRRLLSMPVHLVDELLELRFCRDCISFDVQQAHDELTETTHIFELGDGGARNMWHDVARRTSTERGKRLAPINEMGLCVKRGCLLQHDMVGCPKWGRL